MSIYKVRGNSHNIVYKYKDADGKVRQHWESYATELEALHRKTYIDYLIKSHQPYELMKEAMEYRRKKELERAISEKFRPEETIPEPVKPQAEDNMCKTYREFAEKWLPYHVRKKRLSPNTFDNYRQNLDNHILPYFGDRVMSTITAEDIDDFLDYLSQKRVKGHQSYGKRLEQIPTLSSSSIKKCFTVLNSGFKDARKWRYISEIPEVTPPSEKSAKRRAWEPARVFEVLESIEDDRLLHLAVHLAFVCSLRAGETVGIDVSSIDCRDASFWITRQIQRVSDESLKKMPSNEVLLIFPKQVHTSKTSMILKGPKTERSHRKQYLTHPLLLEIQERLNEIEENKRFFGHDYVDYGLLFCQPDGRPLDPKSLDKMFKRHQARMGIPPEEQIEFQGLRKSGQMHKVRLSMNNYQLVAESSGQSPEVLMSNYNEALDSEKRALARMVEGSFYPAHMRQETASTQDTLAAMLASIQENPDLGQQLLQNLLLNAVPAQKGA